MAALTYTINGQFFPTQQALQQHVSQFLHGHRAPYRLADDEAAFMLDLLERHPSAETKIGVGVESIWILSNGKFGNGFYVQRVDGTREDFSYKQCLRPFTHASKCKFAFRRAVDDQVNAVKRTVFPRSGMRVPCPITGEPMTWETAHVDHEPPRTFALLLETYLSERGIDYDMIALLEPEAGIGKHLPPALEADWAVWHSRYARLRVISAEANLRLVGR